MSSMGRMRILLVSQQIDGGNFSSFGVVASMKTDWEFYFLRLGRFGAIFQIRRKSISFRSSQVFSILGYLTFSAF